MEPEQLFTTLSKKAGFEVVNSSGSSNQLRFLGRVQGAENTARWLVVVEKLLTKASESSLNLDVSKQYFLRGGKLLYGWRVILQSADLPADIQVLETIVRNAPSRVAVVSDEVPLNASPNRNVLRNGKGAQNTLSAVVGPGARGLNG